LAVEDDALLTIKEFSDLTGVNQSTLRYYDEIGLLPPESRGAENNYRYYTPLQMQTVNFINVLVNLGVPLSKINEMVSERTPENVVELLGRQEILLDRRLYEIRTSYSIIHTFRKNIENGLHGRAGEIRVESLDELNYILGPVNDFEGGRNFYDTFKSFCKAANEYRINLDYPVGGYFYDMESFMANPDKPDKYFSLDSVGNCTRHAGDYLVGYRRGYHGSNGFFGENADMPMRLQGYANENRLRLRGPVYAVYLLNEISNKAPEEYLSRISISVTRERDGRCLAEYPNARNCPIKSRCVRPHCETFN